MGSRTDSNVGVMFYQECKINGRLVSLGLFLHEAILAGDETYRGPHARWITEDK